MNEDTAESFSESLSRNDGGFDHFLWKNPVIRKELRGRMRGLRAYIILTIYLVLVSALVGTVYGTYAINNADYYDPNARQELGKILFAVVLFLQIALVNFVAPALTSGSISAERERQTLDLLRATLLSANSLVSGKMISAMLFLLLLLVAALPLQSISFILGGVELPELIISTLLLIISTFSFCTIAIFFSSLVKSTLSATVLSYLVSNFILLGLPAILLILVAVSDPILYDLDFLDALGLDIFIEVVIIFIGWVLVSLNPISAAIASEVMLIEEQTLLYSMYHIAGSVDIPLISPWIPFSIFYILVSIIFYLLSILLVNRKDP
jgi:ABC-type transport system involved in multi-copper enzyme maturation permease subunit